MIIFYIISIAFISVMLNKTLPPTYEKNKDYIKKVEKLYKVLPNFKYEEFKKYVFESYKNIQISYSSLDTETIRKYTTDELYHMYISRISAIKNKNVKNIMKDFEVLSVEVTDIEIENKIISITLRFKTECYDYKVNKDNEIVKGTDKCKVSYDYSMTFIKSISDDINKCQNCGAQLENTNSVTCPYCDSHIINKNYDWVLSKIRIITRNGKLI